MSALQFAHAEVKGWMAFYQPLKTYCMTSTSQRAQANASTLWLSGRSPKPRLLESYPNAARPGSQSQQSLARAHLSRGCHVTEVVCGDAIFVSALPRHIEMHEKPEGYHIPNGGQYSQQATPRIMQDPLRRLLQFMCCENCIVRCVLHLLCAL